MKVNLLVLTEGKMKGKAIPIPLPQFLIGRDKICHLRPASPVISNRHCAIVIRQEDVFLRDFDSTNGTFLNDQQVKGEMPLADGDLLRVGPMAFKVQIAKSVPVSSPTPLPPTKKSTTVTGEPDDEAAALLLSLEDGTTSTVGGPALDSDGVPTGSTIMEVSLVPPEQPATEGAPKAEENGKKPEPNKKEKKKEELGNTRDAAANLLQKYMRRSRTPSS